MLSSSFSKDPVHHHHHLFLRNRTPIANHSTTFFYRMTSFLKRGCITTRRQTQNKDHFVKKIVQIVFQMVDFEKDTRKWLVSLS
jgi:hypothetical protein